MPNLAILAHLMDLYGKNNYKLCLEWVLGHLGTKSINKKKISIFRWKTMIFQKKIQIA